MWVFTQEGFYSAVHDSYCGPGELMIRARVREDLVTLAEAMGMHKLEILHIEHADYRYRMKVRAKAWGKYLAMVGAGINYPNVKNELATDNERHSAMYRCWQALHDWQEKRA